MLLSIKTVARSSKRILHETRIAPYSVSSINRYHSYPNPDEKPQISTTTSTVKKQLNKDEFALDNKFKMEKVFPGIVLGNPIRDSTTPQTIATKLSNGLTVATQEMPGLMTSLAFVVKTGSSFENQKDHDPENNLGASHFLELNAFRTTENKSHLQVSKLNFCSKFKQAI